MQIVKNTTILFDPKKPNFSKKLYIPYLQNLYYTS